MSYFDTPHINFYGNFTADTPTANNITSNFNPTNWPHDVSPEELCKPGWSEGNWHNLWNPCGSNAWTITCTVQSFVDCDGQLNHRHNSSDPLIGAMVNSSTDREPHGISAKIVDFDVDQQRRERLFGLYFDFSVKGNTSSLLKGAFDDGATLRNYWRVRIVPSGLLSSSKANSPQGQPQFTGLSTYGAAWQSVILNPIWGDVSSSPYLQQLYEASPHALSIRLVAYEFNGNPQSSEFKQGKLVGTIGPYQETEPKYMLANRLLSPCPEGCLMWNAPFKVDPEKKRLTIDFGNAIVTEATDNDVESVDFGRMQAAICQNNAPIFLGQEIDYSQENYVQTSGIIQIDLSEYEQSQIDLLKTSPVFIITSKPPYPDAPSFRCDMSDGDGNKSEEEWYIALTEATDGRYIVGDKTTLQLNSGEHQSVTLYATKFGCPEENYSINLGYDSSTDTDSGLSYPRTVRTNDKGQAQVTFTAGDPNSRPFINGQLYFIGGDWETFEDVSSQAPLTVKVFSRLDVPNPTWEKDIKPIFEQYAYLYPYMRNLLDLSNYDVVCKSENRKQIKDKITLPFSDPDYMPVSRDLSHDQINMIVKWIDNDCPKE